MGFCVVLFVKRMDEVIADAGVGKGVLCEILPGACGKAVYAGGCAGVKFSVGVVIHSHKDSAGA